MTTHRSNIPKIVAVRDVVSHLSLPCITVFPDQKSVLLSLEIIERADRVFGLNLRPGDAGEMLTVQGLDTASLKPGDELRIGEEVVLRLESIGRLLDFHVILASGFSQLLSQHGVSTFVEKGGLICNGDKILF